MERLGMDCGASGDRRGPHVAVAVTDQSDDPRFRDPLSEVTRKERKFLLAISLATIVLTSLHEKITKIPLIEIETDGLSVASQRTILTALAFVVLYALVAFVVYAWADFVAWRQIIARSDADLVSKMLFPVVRFAEGEVFGAPDPNLKEQLTASRDLAMGRHGKWAHRVRRVSFLRAAWDFFLPLAAGLYSLAMVSWRALTAC
jgi:hypothetical protein